MCTKRIRFLRIIITNGFLGSDRDFGSRRTINVLSKAVLVEFLRSALATHIPPVRPPALYYVAICVYVHVCPHDMYLNSWAVFSVSFQYIVL